MLPLPFASQARTRAGFTLIELLVVITIIAILASILLTVFGTVQNRARKVQAINDMRNVKVALISYYSDYRKYPINQSQQDAAMLYNLGDSVYGDPGGPYSSADLFNILRAVADGNQNPNNVLNPNQVVYWPGGFAKDPKKPRSGITTQDVTVSGVTIPMGSMVDPWGNAYVVFIDANMDGDVSEIVGHFYQSTPKGTVVPGLPPLGFSFASMGADGKFGTKGNGILAGSDDVVSWQ